MLSTYKKDLLLHFSLYSQGTKSMTIKCRRACLVANNGQAESYEGLSLTAKTARQIKMETR